MAVLLNATKTAYTVTDVNVGLNVAAPSVVGITLSGVQEANRRLIALVYLYRRIADPALTEFFSIEALEIRQRRTGIRFAYNLQSTDIIRFIPLYNFNQVVILVQQSGA